MRPKTITTLLSATPAVLADCPAGLYMVVARGTGEEPGLGTMGVVAQDVAAAVPGSTVVPLDYPAAFSNYYMSEDTGVSNLQTLLDEQLQECPDSLMVLFGYSQGAQVVTDVLCGGSEVSFNDEPPIATSIMENNIVAAVMYGDPSHNLTAEWTIGSATKNGLFTRRNTTACDPYTPKLRSYCDAGDTFCDLGNNTAVHGMYHIRYRNDTVNFVLNRYRDVLATRANNGTSGDNGNGGGGTAGAGVVVAASGWVMAASLLVALMLL